MTRGWDQLLCPPRFACGHPRVGDNVALHHSPRQLVRRCRICHRARLDAFLAKRGVTFVAENPQGRRNVRLLNLMQMRQRYRGLLQHYLALSTALRREQYASFAVYTLMPDGEGL